MSFSKYYLIFWFFFKVFSFYTDIAYCVLMFWSNYAYWKTRAWRCKIFYFRNNLASKWCKNVDTSVIQVDSENIETSDAIELTTEEVAMETAYNSQMEDIAQAYIGKPVSECTYEELTQAYTLSLIEGSLESSKIGLREQDDSDGWISEFFDFCKDVTNLGTSQEDVEKAISEQEKVLLD